jgi:hypothetical protein
VAGTAANFLGKSMWLKIVLNQLLAESAELNQLLALSTRQGVGARDSQLQACPDCYDLGKLREYQLFPMLLILRCLL